jgi:hypothetical protein
LLVVIIHSIGLLPSKLGNSDVGSLTKTYRTGCFCLCCYSCLFVVVPVIPSFPLTLIILPCLGLVGNFLVLVGVLGHHTNDLIHISHECDLIVGSSIGVWDLWLVELWLLNMLWLSSLGMRLIRLLLLEVLLSITVILPHKF